VSVIHQLRPRPRWPFVVGAIAIVGVLVVVATVLYLRSDRIVDSYGPRVRWQPTQQHLLQSPMSARPVPGWRLTATDLGLPEGSQLSTDDMPIHSQPLIGSIGNRSFFLVRKVGTPTEWWLAGIDVSRGQRLFTALALNVGSRPKCFLNGPDEVLCLTSDIADRTAWVVNSHSGAVTFNGPTDLNVRPNDLNVAQVGIYAVAESVDEGIYGIGQKADTTWFVPGAGDVTPKYLDLFDSGLPPIAFQTTSGRGSFGKVVFSLVNGRVIKPQLPSGAEQQGTALYHEGFASQIQLSDLNDEIQFFDESGKRTAPRSFTGGWTNAMSYFDLPIIVHPDHDHAWVALTSTGRLVFAAPKDAGSPVRIVGSRLIAAASDFSTRGWAQYDLESGTSGKRCTNLDMDAGYLGFDGRVAVTSDGNQTVGLDTEATDLDTCERLWVISSAPGSWRDVWRINTTLVQLSDDGTELMSLVAPG